MEAWALKPNTAIRSMKLGIVPNSPDHWGRQLAAGGDEEN